MPVHPAKRLMPIAKVPTAPLDPNCKPADQVEKHWQQSDAKFDDRDCQKRRSAPHAG
jgi:hypothetical protein